MTEHPVAAILVVVVDVLAVSALAVEVLMTAARVLLATQVAVVIKIMAAASASPRAAATSAKAVLMTVSPAHATMPQRPVAILERRAVILVPLGVTSVRHVATSLPASLHLASLPLQSLATVAKFSYHVMPRKGLHVTTKS